MNTTFNEVYTSCYDELYAEKDYSSECDLIEAAVKKYANFAPRDLLDVGCGTGGHAIELAKRGFKVTGIDLSQSMLDCASQKAEDLPVEQRPQWLCGNARDFNTNKEHDIAVMMFAVIGYLTTNDDVISCLRNIRRQLKAGAIFVCDFWYGPSVLSIRPTDRIRELKTPNSTIIRAAHTSLDIEHHTADVTFNLWVLNKDHAHVNSKEVHRLRYFFPQEFAFFLKTAGFELNSISAFPSLEVPLSDDTWNAIIVATAV